MKDEEFVFRSDVREKSSIARSARNRRTHNGKGGRVRLPSDYLTQKEKNAMSGEVKSYRLNDPMNWKEFKAMPDDIKVTYIKLLREKFNCFDAAIAEMMGVNKVSLSQEIKRLGLGYGKKHGGNRKWPEKEAFYACVHGVPVEAPVEETIVEEAEEILQETPVEAPEEPIVEEAKPEIKKAIPSYGKLVFEGKADEALNSLAAILGNAYVHISIGWDVIPEPCVGVRENGN